MSRLKIYITLFLSISSAFYSSSDLAETSTADNIISSQSNVSLPKNIIMIIADGMGPAYTTAYRYYQDSPQTTNIETTVFDRHLKGLVSTSPAPISGYVTDSGAAATALATGIKTYNDAIGIDVHDNQLGTVFDWAKKQGKKTGVVVTTRINHATPAAYLTHNNNRENYDEIANSYIDNGIEADLYFGGGWHNFIREDRNLVEEFKQNGFQYIDSYNQLTSLSKSKPVLGLFANYALPAAIDDTNRHRLAMLAKFAIKQLTNEAGFFMLVEASQIDWAGHDNDIAQAMHEMDDLAKTVEYLEGYVKDNPDTLVILTADHSTGGLSIAAKQEYIWQPSILHSVAHSTRFIADKIIAQGEPIRENINQWLSFEITHSEFQSLIEVEINYNQALKQFNINNEDSVVDDETMTKKYFYRKALAKIIDERTNTGWTTEGHTGIDVPLYSFGYKSEIFSGQYDNTEIANEIFRLLGRVDKK